VRGALFLALMTVLLSATVVVGWMGQHPPSSSSEVRRWLTAALAFAVAMIGALAMVRLV
jgi:TRAP-type C4-dicarboxylate transport system permease small subunit